MVKSPKRSLKVISPLPDENKKPFLRMRDDIVTSLTAGISPSMLNVLHGELPQRQIVGKHVEVG